MKLHFEPNLDYQLRAMEAVCDLFRGQEICRTEFTVTRDAADPQLRMDFAESDLGLGNRLTLLDDELIENLNAVQTSNGLRPSDTLASGDFTVEMETGTGAPSRNISTRKSACARRASKCSPSSSSTRSRSIGSMTLTAIR
jgi:type III restriction enzyme